jgi:predicted nucleotidyltransferase
MTGMRTLDQISLNENDRGAVTEVVSLLKQCFPIEKVLLFGSKVRGQDSAESDIDLLVLTSRPVSRLEKRQMRHAIFDVQVERAVVIDMLVVPAEEWGHGLYQVLPIRREVEAEGVLA